MPCYSPGAQEEASSYEVSELKKELNKVTRMLCLVLQKGAPSAADIKEVQDWYKQHAEWDKKRND